VARPHKMLDLSSLDWYGNILSIWMVLSGGLEFYIGDQFTESL
jgi:hypothetical protein